MASYTSLILQFDGACRGNGRKNSRGGSGWVLRTGDGGENRKLAQGYFYVGSGCTSNVCEYFGLISGLKYILDEQIGCDRLHIQGDSELAIKHLNREYDIKSFRLRPLVRRVRGQIRNLEGNPDVNFTHIPRQRNNEADRLANEAIEEEATNIEEIYN